MNSDFVLLTEKEAMWSEMLKEVLQDNGIPCVAVPVFGAGFTLRTGVQERLKIFVPPDQKLRAEELMYELFPSEDVQ